MNLRNKVSDLAAAMAIAGTAAPTAAPTVRRTKVTPGAYGRPAPKGAPRLPRASGPGSLDAEWGFVRGVVQQRGVKWQEGYRVAHGQVAHRSTLDEYKIERGVIRGRRYS